MFYPKNLVYTGYMNMIRIERTIEFNCTKKLLDKALLNFNKIYPLYSPTEHIKCEYIRGDLLHENSILYFEEYISGKKQQMKYKVTNIIDQNDVRIICLKAMFPRSLFNIHAHFNFRIIADKVSFTRTLSLGTDIFLLGYILDKLTFLLGGKYIQDIKEHEERDLYQLKEFIETQYS